MYKGGGGVQQGQGVQFVPEAAVSAERTRPDERKCGEGFVKQ